MLFFTILVFWILHFFEGFFKATVLDLFGPNMILVIMSLVSIIIFPLIAIYISHKWRNIKLREINTRKYFLYILCFLYLYLLVNIIFTGLDLQLPDPDKVAKDPRQFDSFIIGQILYEISKPIWIFLIFIASFLFFKKK